MIKSKQFLYKRKNQSSITLSLSNQNLLVLFFSKLIIESLFDLHLDGIKKTCKICYDFNKVDQWSVSKNIFTLFNNNFVFC
jgi:hypothetical protein